MSNLTFMDGDTFSNFDLNNGTIEEYEHYERHIFFEILYVAIEIVKLIICLGSTGASIFLIYVISKFARLRTKTNIFFLHYAIACCVDNMLIPFFMIIHEFLFRHWIFMCATYDGSTATVIMIFVFATAINLYWFLQTFKTEWLQNCQRFQLIFTVALYVFCLIKFIVCMSECFMSQYHFTNHLLMAIYIIMLAITIGINVFTFKHGLNDVQRKTQYQSCISTYIIVSYFPFFLISELLGIFGYEMVGLVEYIFMIVYCTTEMVAYSGPIVVVYLLGQRNKYFKAAYNKVFKRSIRSYEDEFDEDSEHEEPVHDSNQTSSSNGLINNSVYAV